MRKFIVNKFLNSKSSENSIGFRKVTNLTVLIVSLGLLFAACDEDPAGPDEDPGDDPDPVEVEAAFTMEPEEPITGVEVTLDASSSSVSNNGDLSYSWALTPPGGSSAELENTDQVNTSFTADEAGDYDIELTVSANGETDETSAVAEVTAEEEISSDITEDRTFSSDVTYIVTSDIDIEANLTIEPGTRIEFENDTGLRLATTSGAIIADGTAEDPILFTGTEEQPGWWNGIYLEESDNLNNQLNHVTVEYGGGNEFRRSGEGNLIIGRGLRDDSSIEVTNSTFRHSASHGIWVRSNGDLPNFANNTVIDNEDAPVNIGSNKTHRLDSGSSFLGNEVDYVYVRGGNDIENDDVTWEALDVPYGVNSSTIEVSGIDWTIEPGATFVFDQGGEVRLVDESAIIANGTAEDPILFTASDEQPGWWNGLYLEETSNANNSLNYVTIEYAGGEEYRRSGEGNLVIARGLRDDSSISVTNSTFRHSASYGLWVRSSGDLPDFENNTFTGNSDAPVNIASNRAHLLDNGSSYTGNDDDYIYVRGGNDIDSENVTWEVTEVPYRISSSTVEIDAVDMTINPGVTLEFEQNGQLRLSGEGGLIADGTEEGHITFTGSDDQPGWWDGIYIEESNNANNLLNFATVEYAGGNEYSRSGEGNVVIGRGLRDDSSIEITNSTISHSDTNGIWVRSNGSVNDDACDVNTFENNSEGDCVVN